MRTLALVLTAFVAVEHIAIMLLEMFFWDHPIGRQIFGMTPEVSAASSVLAANQGLYNGFLAAGLVWGLFEDSKKIKLFFLGCVIAAGIFGGVTAKPSIIAAQALPAAAAFLANLLARPGRRKYLTN